MSSNSVIAATAIEHGFSLVTRNAKHFNGFGLDVIDPWACTGSVSQGIQDRGFLGVLYLLGYRNRPEEGASDDILTEHYSENQQKN